MSDPSGREKRRFPRLSKPFDGTWRGASGGSPCRLTDLSLGGCYVQSLATPTKGEETTVTVIFGDGHTMSFVGSVVYTEPNMGFAVEFRPMTKSQVQELGILIDALRAQS
jgi:hypothetical protein